MYLQSGYFLVFPIYVDYEQPSSLEFFWHSTEDQGLKQSNVFVPYIVSLRAWMGALMKVVKFHSVADKS